MYLYDKAHELAAEIKKSPEFLEYKKLKDEIFADATTKDLVNQYKSLQIEGQAAILSGQQPGQEGHARRVAAAEQRFHAPAPLSARRPSASAASMLHSTSSALSKNTPWMSG